MTGIHRIAAILLIIQGAGHTFAGTPMFYVGVSQDAVWFASAGLAMIFLGILNLLSLGDDRTAATRALALANFLWVAAMFGLLYTTQSLRAIVAVVLALTCLLASLVHLGGKLPPG